MEGETSVKGQRAAAYPGLGLAQGELLDEDPNDDTG